MRCYLMRRMIDPVRLAENEPGATGLAFAAQLEHKTDAEAVKDWEDEGGASRHSSGSSVANDVALDPENKTKEEAKCT